VRVLAVTADARADEQPVAPGGYSPTIMPHAGRGRHPLRCPLDCGIAPLILGVGLTRKYRPSETAAYSHWLQVTNIHLAADPIWRLG